MFNLSHLRASAMLHLNENVRSFIVKTRRKQEGYKVCIILCILLILPYHTAYAINLSSVKDQEDQNMYTQYIAQLPKEADLSDSFLQLVNKENRLDHEPVFETAYTVEGLPYHAGASQALNDLLAAATQSGLNYQIISAFRSMDDQAVNRQNRYQYYLNIGMSQDDAQYWLDAYYAPVNGTEHLLGLAFDMFGTQWLSRGGLFSNEYSQTMEYQWMRDNAHKFGFILRFPENKSDITGIFFEPWHYRYVGKVHAEFMHQHDLTLEEYLYMVELRDSKKKTVDSSQLITPSNLNTEPKKKGNKVG